MPKGNEIFRVISERVQQDPRVQKNTKRGLCRQWTKFARKAAGETAIAMEGAPDIRSEAREVDISPSLSHTFLRLTINGRPFLMDGTGVEHYPPYFGPEETAPEHLQNSWSDMINRH